MIRVLGVVTLFCLTIGCSYSQRGTKCNRAVDVPAYKKKIIKEVCIPYGQVITLLYTDLRDIDWDGDSIGDFIFSHRKPGLKEMDTIYLSVYKKINDSTHIFLKTFNNLFPVYLKSYDYSSKNVFAAKVFECYADGYPLKSLVLKNGSIAMMIRIDAASGYFLKYTYLPQKRNWYLTTYQEWFDKPHGERKFEERKIPEEGESIDEFSYRKYLCPELFENK